MDATRGLSVEEIIETMGSETDRQTARYMRASNGEKAKAFRSFIDAASRELTVLMHVNNPLPAKPGSTERKGVME